MKRHVVIAVACAALVVLAAAACSSGDDEATPGTQAERPENPISVSIAQNAMLTSDDFPAWWEVSDASEAVGEALLAQFPECDALASSDLTARSKRDGRAGPTTYQETDGIRRVDLSIRVYPDTADAEEAMADFEASDTPQCLDAAFGSIGPPDANPGPAEWTDPPPFGDQSLAITIPVAPGETVTEDSVLYYFWVRVDRAVFQLTYGGPVADDPETYVNTVATRLSEEFAEADTSN